MDVELGWKYNFLKFIHIIYIYITLNWNRIEKLVINSIETCIITHFLFTKKIPINQKMCIFLQKLEFKILFGQYKPS